MVKLPGIVIERSDTHIVVDVGQPIESLNNFLGEKVSPMAWKYYKARWSKALTVVKQRKREEFKSYVTIISYRNRRLDKENLYGGSKPIRDCLARRGWIWNDSPAWGDLHVLQEQCKKQEQRTIIRVDIVRKEKECSRIKGTDM